MADDRIRLDATLPDAASVLDLLDRIPGAGERIDSGIADVRAGRTIPFDE